MRHAQQPPCLVPVQRRQQRRAGVCGVVYDQAVNARCQHHLCHVQKLVRGKVRRNIDKQQGVWRVGVPCRQGYGKETTQGLTLLEGAQVGRVWGGDIEYKVADVAPQLPDADGILCVWGQEIKVSFIFILCSF